MGIDQTTLVLGGTGKTGRRVIQRLQARGVSVRAGSRSGSPRFDWDVLDTWPAALRNAARVYITYQPDLALAGAADVIQSLTDLAVLSGVKRLVLLSGRGEPEALRCEEVVKNSGVEWTIVRASWFNQNFSETFLLESVLGGEVALPIGHVGEPFIDADDIADVAVAALTEDRHAGRVYEVTGPRLLTFPGAVDEIAHATGRSLRYESVTPGSYASALAQHDVPPDLARLIMYLFTEVLDGRNAYLADGVEQALGRPPRDFSDYARSAAASGVWNPVATLAESLVRR